MKYFIKSLKWTKNDKVETWWRANGNGYTRYISAAGIYKEEDKKRLAEEIERKVVKFIPITRKLVLKGIKQLNNDIEIENKEIKRLLDSIMYCKRNIEKLEIKTKEFRENLGNKYL